VGGETRARRYAAHAVATIPNGQSLSGAIDLSDYALAGLIIPAAWTAASITFVAAESQGGAYGPVYDDAGTEVTIASASVVASRVIVNKAVLEQLAALRWVKIRSGTASAAVNQGADRAIIVLLKA
jgi:hypothetical protein